MKNDCCIRYDYSLSVVRAKTILHCGKLVDPQNLKVLTEMSVVVEGNKITDVQNGYTSGAAGDKIIELKDKTVMPGLIDCHVHDHAAKPFCFHR